MNGILMDKEHDGRLNIIMFKDDDFLKWKIAIGIKYGRQKEWALLGGKTGSLLAAFRDRGDACRFLKETRSRFYALWKRTVTVARTVPL